MLSPTAWQGHRCDPRATVPKLATLIDRILLGEGGTWVQGGIFQRHRPSEEGGLSASRVVVVLFVVVVVVVVDVVVVVVVVVVVCFSWTLSRQTFPHGPMSISQSHDWQMERETARSGVRDQ